MTKLSFDKESFKTHLQSDAKAFLKLTNCIDKKFYLPQTEEEKSYNSRYMFNKRKENQDPSHLKKLAKEAKKAKLNPDNENDTVNAIKAHKLKEEEDDEFDSEEEDEEDEEEEDEDEDEDDAESDHEGISEDDDNTEDDDDDDDEGSENYDSEDENPEVIESNFEIEDQEQKDAISPIIISDNEIAQLQPSTQLTQVGLKEKLRQKIQESRQLRGAEDPKKREKILKKREAKKQGKKNKKKAKLDVNGTPNVSIAPSAEKVVVDDKAITSKKQQKTKNVESIKEDADVFFGALEFEGVQKKKQTKNAHHLLKKVEAQTEKINKLTQENPEKAKEFVEKEKLHKAVLQASGVKVRDDPKLLKKTLKRQERKKVKTAERWNDIKKKESKGIKDKIKKRETNIKARGDQKKERKMGIKPKSKQSSTVKKPFKGNKQAKKDAKKK